MFKSARLLGDVHAVAVAVAVDGSTNGRPARSVCADERRTWVRP